MMRETEQDYVASNEHMDSAASWASEGGYFKGLGDSWGGIPDLIDATITPSGSATRQTGESSGGGWVDAFKAALPAVAGVIQQRDFNKMNLALINTGRPPMSAQQYQQVYQPATQVAVGPTADAKRWIVYAGIGLIALVGLRAAKII